MARNFLILGGILLSATSLAQMTTDEVPRERTVRTQDSVKDAVENRKFRLGPFRLNPILEISDLGYDSNVFGSPAGQEVGDWTTEVRAGFQWIVPIGSKLYVVGEVTPSYLWYKNLVERRTSGGRYATNLLGFFNRASLQVGGYNTKTVNQLTAESPAQAIETVLDGTVKLEIDLFSNLSVYGNVEAGRFRYGAAGADPTVVDTSALQRQEAAARGGLRYRFSSSWDMSFGYEKTRTEFVNVSQQRDNQSDAYVLGVNYSRPRFFLSLSGGYREGKPYNGSTFAPYSNGTGSYFASYSLNRIVELSSYGSQRISYGVNAAQFLETEIGGGVSVQATPRVSLSLSAATGNNKYDAFTSTDGVFTAARTDKVNSYSAGLTALVYRQMVISVAASRSDYQSDIPSNNRKVFRVTSTFGFQGLFKK